MEINIIIHTLLNDRLTSDVVDRKHGIEYVTEKNNSM